MRELHVELPKPMFVGTPRGLLVRRGQESVVKSPVMMPVDAVLLSANKPVTASDSLPIIGELTMVTDGDKEGRDGSYVELGPGPQFVQIDLMATSRVYAVAVWHYHAQARVYRDVVVLLAGDAAFEQHVVVYDNDDDNSLGFGEGLNDAYIETNQGLLIGVDGILARYVRLYSNGNSANAMNHYVEVEVYGVPGR